MGLLPEHGQRQLEFDACFPSVSGGFSKLSREVPGSQGHGVDILTFTFSLKYQDSLKKSLLCRM